MEYKDTKYNHIVVGENGVIYTTFYSGYTTKKYQIKNGLQYFKVKNKKNIKTVSVSRLVAELYVPNPNNYKYVITIDGNKLNTRPCNLIWSKTNRMDYTKFSKKKKGMFYKKYEGEIYNNHIVIKDKGDTIYLKCISCNNKISANRKKLKRKKFKDCSKCSTYPLKNTQLISPNFNGWTVKENKLSINTKNYFEKKLTISCNCCDETHIIPYQKFKNKKGIYTCKELRKKIKSLNSRRSNIKVRCYNKNNKDYKRYGARGITMCDEWLNDASSFRDWSLKNGFNDTTLEIDRIDNDKGYSPDNCQYLSREKHTEKHNLSV